MKNIIEEYRLFCDEYNIPCTVEPSVRSYDDSTLFCPAGMQQFKAQFKDDSYQNTVANVQPCIRMNDFDEIGDSTHLLYFNMIGLFSFRQMGVEEAIRFWVLFLKRIGLTPDYVTVHSNRSHWANYYISLGIEDVRVDDDNCQWSDGEIGGYCTEFYIGGVEIGNIVNPLDNCIDVGFGLERLDMFVNGTTVDKTQTLKDTALKIIESGFHPSNLKQGYVLRKILRELYKSGNEIDHPYFIAEIDRQHKILEKYERLKTKHADKPSEWWYDTHGIDLSEVTTQTSSTHAPARILSEI